MLVLGRKLNEKIIIGEDIEIQVVNISRNKVRIGINAPTHVKIIREELLDEFEEESFAGD